MSEAHFELITNGRIARKIGDADDATIRAIGRSEVSSDHAALDNLWITPDRSY